MRHFAFTIVLLLGASLAVRAEDQGPVEKTGTTVEKAAKKTGQTVEHAASATGQTDESAAVASDGAGPADLDPDYDDQRVGRREA